MGIILPVVRTGEDGVHPSLFKLLNSSTFTILSNYKRTTIHKVRSSNTIEV